MKKIFVDVYLAYNLGDDLFLDILSKSYPEAEFTVNYVGSDYDEFIAKYKNVNRRKYTLLDKVLQKLKIKDTLTNYKDIAENHDAMIFIGGSIFRDESYHESLYRDRMNMVEAFEKLNKPVFVVGSNFGPYTRECFLSDYRKFYSKCEDVCFRDSYSYNLFKDMKNVRYQPDIVFQLDLDKLKNNNKENTIGFSIIDVNHKDGLAKYEDEYINSNVKTIELLVSKGYRCCLMSFCEKEGDLQAINKILEKLRDETKREIDIYEYKGNLEEAFKLISKFKLFIAARFHANIIAQLLSVPILPVIYSNKTSNMLKDIGLDKFMITMDKLEDQYNEEVIVEAFNNKVDLTNILMQSKKQFDYIDKFIKL
ncbi:polysaccharide pyruvyl transferase family protein [Clostridium celatum]|uniref:polysaccharide pyruvyl transferase family protein n=1 Tax=Clostridium celatum TaxID=36834 RepID=UPI0029019E49|nr:polysaccharide pyruvyl transferase family protein [Clostridium celatum]MDU2265557.1 polysaccharide pyruvyl transferase family protein [Clostridium celatum]MDU6295413.1 polysaccharide pyruvyl transferase family protein [Clostridium celatum]